MIEPRSTETVSSGDAQQPSAIRLFDPGTEIAARYEVKGVLGVGGSAVVYRVFDLELKRELALKVLRHHAHRQGGFPAMDSVSSVPSRK